MRRSAAIREPQITLPDMGARAAYGWGLGLMPFDWDGVPVVGHDGQHAGPARVPASGAGPRRGERSAT